MRKEDIRLVVDDAAKATTALRKYEMELANSTAKTPLQREVQAAILRCATKGQSTAWKDIWRELSILNKTDEGIVRTHYAEAIQLFQMKDRRYVKPIPVVHSNPS